MNRIKLMRTRLAVLQPEQFAGKPTVARHRMVYFALGEMLKQKHEIHALHITVSTSEYL